jgi:hypothetical protein
MFYAAVMPTTPPNHSLILTIRPDLSNKSIPGDYMITLSNYSDHSVEYSTHVIASYMVGDLWLTSNVSGGGNNSGLLRPKRTQHGFVQMPNNATRIKVGVYYTSLTWRGALDYDTIDLPLRGIYVPMLGFLLMQDEKHRTKIDWSQVYSLNELNSTRQP